MKTNWTNELGPGLSGRLVQYPFHKDSDHSIEQTFQDQVDSIVCVSTFSAWRYIRPLFQFLKRARDEKDENCLRRTNRSENRFQRRLTGASTLTSRKKGRRINRSRIAPSAMSVVTQRSCHRFVTKSRSDSGVENTNSDGVVPFLSILDAWSRRWSFASRVAFWLDWFVSSKSWKPWCWIRYSAIACLPAQMPLFD